MPAQQILFTHSVSLFRPLRPGETLVEIVLLLCSNGKFEGDAKSRSRLTILSANTALVNLEYAAANGETETGPNVAVQNTLASQANPGKGLEDFFQLRRGQPGSRILHSHPPARICPP